jgi:glutathione S-transferase
MKVYGHPMSGSTRLVLLALAEKNVKPEFVMIDFTKGEHKHPDHVARQPFGRMPAFEHEGFTMFESRAIARYIDEAIPGEHFIPADLKERAVMEQWMTSELTEFQQHAQPIVFELVFKKVFNMGESDMAKVEASRKNLHQTFAVMDKALEGKSYLAANKFTLADMVYMPVMEYLHAAGEGDAIAKFPNVARWWKGISGRKTWAAVTATPKG